MLVDVALLPSLLSQSRIVGRAVVVFDVLRATTTMTAALAAGVSEIRIYPETAAAARAAGSASPTRLLCGEEKCLPHAGFDLGNSPGAFSADQHGRVMHMSTTNGTRAIVAARGAAVVYAGALVNAAAVARELSERGRDVTLLCAGTDGAIAVEDVIGAGAVLDALYQRGAAPTREASDECLVARDLFRASRDSLRAAIGSGRGGRNVVAAGLSSDIDFAARLDAIDVVGVIDGAAFDPPVMRRAPA